MALLHSNGILEVSSIPLHTPTSDQAKFARLTDTSTFFYWNGSAWITLTPSTLDEGQGTSFSGGSVDIGDDAAGVGQPGVLTSDRFINLDGNKVSFVGLANTTEVETFVDGEGVLNFTSDNRESGVRYIAKIDPIQKSQGTPTFNFSLSTVANSSIAENDNVFYWGWNAGPGGPVDPTKTATIFSMENNWEITPGELVAEVHLAHLDLAQVARRPISIVLHESDQSQSSVSFTIQNFYLREHTGGIDWYFRAHYGATDAEINIINPVSNEGLQIYTDTDNVQLLPYGPMTNPGLHLTSFYQTNIKRLVLDSMFPGFGDPDTILGWNANGPVSGITYGSSTYTPTRSAESNLDSNVTPSEAQYLRIGSTVTVSGRVTVNPTASGAVSFELSLPVASNIGAVEDLAGTAFGGDIAGLGAAVLGSVANNTAVFNWVAVDVSSQAMSYTYTYQILA